MKNIKTKTNKMLKKINKLYIKNKFLMYNLIFVFTMFTTNNIFANDLMNNPITEGAKKMLQDASNLLMILASLAAPVCIGFFQFKKKFSDDEMEAKQYDKKTKAVIVSYVVIMTAGVIISVVSNYFKAGASV